MGQELADQITGGTRLYVVAVHVTQARLHAHIIIANHNQATGRANQWGAHDLQNWRRISDRMMRERGLTTLPDPKIGRQLPQGDTKRQSVGHLYAMADGRAWTDRLKEIIDDASTLSSTWPEFRTRLHEQGVSVILRGRHMTYMITTDGTKIRDTRLGEAYTPSNVWGRLSKRPVTEISFSTRLIIHHGDTATRIMIPGTHGNRRLTIDESRILKTGPNTWHAWLPQDRPLVLTDRRGRLAGRIRAADLTRAFIQPGQSLEHEYRALRPTISTAAARQANRAYVWQARRLARAAQQADALRITEANDHGGHDAQAAISSLISQISAARSSLAAQIAAMADAASRGSRDPSQAESQEERDARTTQIGVLQQRLENLAWQVRTLRAASPGTHVTEDQPKEEQEGPTL